MQVSHFELSCQYDVGNWIVDGIVDDRSCFNATGFRCASLRCHSWMESDCLLSLVGAAGSAVDPATGFDGVLAGSRVDPATGFDGVLAGSRGLVSRPDLVEIFASALE
jgi:hypothetical protein